MNILTVGFGNMGCRHTQSLLGGFPDSNFFVLEPNEEIYKANLNRIGANELNIKRVSSFDELHQKIDFAVVATSSFPRFEIVKKLLELGVSKMLVEKVVFQSESQFDQIISLCELKNARIYCNFVSRYFPNYQKIKKDLTNKPITMNVTGGDFGLGCNALHYVDLFEYFTGGKSTLSGSSMVENFNGNRRGNIYREVSGNLIWETENGDRLIISSDLKRQGGNEIIINQIHSTDILNEETLNHYHFDSDKIDTSTFELLYTSSLTKVILNDILNDKVILPTIQETKSCHVQFFKAVNPIFGIAENDICPLT